MTTIKTYDRVGIREDLSDVVYNVDPTSNPYTRMLKTEKRHNTLYEWQEDEYQAVDSDVAVEGADAVTEERAPTLRRANTTSIVQKSFQISDALEQSSLAGRKSETAFQTLKISKELARKLEHLHIGKPFDATVGNASTPRRFGNILGSDATVGGALQNVSNRLDAGGNALSEDNILDIHQAGWEEGADFTHLMVTPADKRKVSAFINNGNRSREVVNDHRTLTNTIDIYRSDFGDLKVVMSRFLQRFVAANASAPEEQDPDGDGDATTNPTTAVSGVALLLDPTKMCSVTRRPFKRTKLAKNGDSERYQVLGEFGFITKNRKTQGIIENLGA